MNLKQLMEHHSRLVRARGEWDSLFQELKELVRPDTTDFGSGSRAPDIRRKIFDGTAPWALEQLSAGLHSYLTSPVDRWFSVGVSGVPYDQHSFEAKAWLDSVSETIYSHYSNPFASFNPAMHECYLDLGTFGTGVIYQWMDMSTMQLMFRSYPLADCWMEEDAVGRIIRVHRRCKWTVAQVREEFGYLPPELSKMGDRDTVEVIHAVFPRTDRNPQSLHPLHRPFASVYFCRSTEELLDEGGYNSMPYMVPRWAKVAGDPYGRSPALSVLADIRMVNAMSKTLIVAAQKITDPPLQVPDDGFMLPLKTHPGGMNYRRPGTTDIIALPTPQRIDIGVEMIEQRREMIRRGFYVDWLVRPSKKERQTAQEIMDDRNQMLSMMGPIVGRLQAELLGPTIRTSYALLARHNHLPDMPAELDGAELDLVYISPAAKAQATVRGQGIQAYLNQIVQLLPVFPEMGDSINAESLNAELQDYTDVPRRVLHDPATVKARREAREEQQQAAQLAQVAPAIGKTAKDLAQAQQAGGTLPI